MQMRAQNVGTSDLGHDKGAVRKILDQAKAAARESLTAPEARGVCEAYGIVIPKEGVAKTADEAAALAASIGFPAVMKIVSPQILHKTEAGGVIVGFQHESTAKRFLVDLRKRLEAFALTLLPAKTRLIQFGRFAAGRRRERGLGKPETFNF